MSDQMIKKKRELEVSDIATNVSKIQKKEEVNIQDINTITKLHHPLFPDDQVIRIEEIEALSELTQMKLNRNIKTVLRLWESDILSESPPSKDKTDLLLETKISLFPLCVQLRKSKISTSIQISLLTIFLHVQRLEFREATQSYMKLSIGNVAWPIGVVNVSIHSRSNQSRLHGKEEANIMISEEVRRWITAVKRLITFMESYYKQNKERFLEHIAKLKKEADVS